MNLRLLNNVEDINNYKKVHLASNVSVGRNCSFKKKNIPSVGLLLISLSLFWLKECRVGDSKGNKRKLNASEKMSRLPSKSSNNCKI